MERSETITISLPPGMCGTVDALVKQGGYNNTSEYFRDLVRRDLDRHHKQALEDKLLRALDADGLELTPELVARWRSEAKAKAKAMARKKAG